jgi:uncharacterized membrane protein YhaH (DUF805 family)
LFVVGGLNSIPQSSDWIILALLAFPLLWIGICAFVKRLHDSGKSMWYVLVGLVPFVGGFILLWFMLEKGTEGPNEHGEDPKGDWMGAGISDVKFEPRVSVSPPPPRWEPPA